MGKYGQLAKLSADKGNKDTPTQPPSQPASQPTSRVADQPTPQPAVEPASDLLIEAIRQGIREPGSRSGTHTFTDVERDWVEELVHTLRKQGHREMSGNMLLRMLVHAAKHEHDALGENSLIERAVRDIL